MQHGPVSIGQMQEYWDGGYLNHESLVFASDGSLTSWTALEARLDAHAWHHKRTLDAALSLSMIHARDPTAGCFLAAAG